MYVRPCACIYMYMYMYIVCVSWGYLDVWGELASHKRSLTHHPSSQGWASRCPVLQCYLGYGWVGYWLGGLLVGWVTGWVGYWLGGLLVGLVTGWGGYLPFLF